MNKEDFKEKYGYSLEEVTKLRDSFKTHRRKKENYWKLIDAYDSGEFWDTMRKNVPKHYIIPDTNYIFYVSNNIIGSTYSSPYFADVLPTNPDDKEGARILNKFLEYKHNEKDMGLKQLQMGTRAAKINVGWLQIGWNKDIEVKVQNETYKGDIEYTVRDTMSVLIDPNYSDYQKGRAAFITTEESLQNLLSLYPNSKDELLEMYNRNSDNNKNKEIDFSGMNMKGTADTGKDYINLDVTPMQEGMVSVTIAYYKRAEESGGMRIDWMVIANDEIVLTDVKGVKPNYFPIIPLYDQPPIKDGYGISTCQRILKNALAINILDAIAVTHVYASQRTPMILDMRSGISPMRLKKDMNNPDRIFTSRGEIDIDKIIQRLEYSDLPNSLPLIRQSLVDGIEMITGIDEKYTGRDTGSVTTTGGMERLQSRSSMTDNIRIAMIEKYAKDWTKMSLDFFILFAKERTFVTTASYQEQVEEVLTVDFTKYKEFAGELGHSIPMSINASPLLPKNRARLAEAANQIMQVQMQYQGQIELLTPEEWLYYQDFPQNDIILDRMKMDRLRNDKEDITAELQNFAGMTESGMRPEAAVDQLAKERAIKREPGVMRKQLQNMK